MNLRLFIIGFLALLSFAMYGCGSGGGGGAGLNGGITVTASATGTLVSATATYSNPTQTNLIGVPITISTDLFGPIGTLKTNNSGSVGVSFRPPAFNGAKTFAVIASIDNLTNFATVTMTGRSLSLTPPPAIAATTALASPVTVDVPIPVAPVFASFSDPFSNTGDLSGFIFDITTSRVDTLANTLVLTLATTTTSAAGVASFPGATATMTAPAAIGGVNTMTITWTISDPVTGLHATGTTTITLTKTA